MTLATSVGPTTTLPKAGEHWQHNITRGVYLIVGIALRKDDDTGGEPTVVYRSMHDEQLYVRSVEHFVQRFSVVEMSDTKTCDSDTTQHNILGDES